MMTVQGVIVVVMCVVMLMIPFASWQYRIGYNKGVQDTYKFLENFDRSVDELSQDL